MGRCSQWVLECAFWAEVVTGGQDGCLAYPMYDVLILGDIFVAESLENSSQGLPGVVGLVSVQGGHATADDEEVIAAGHRVLQ